MFVFTKEWRLEIKELQVGHLVVLAEDKLFGSCVMFEDN